MAPQTSVTVHAPAANTDAVVTLAAPSDSAMRWVIEGWQASADKAPLAAVVFTIVSDSVTLESARIPAAAFSPVISGTPVYGGRGASVVCTLPALGADVSGTVRVSARQELF